MNDLVLVFVGCGLVVLVALYQLMKHSIRDMDELEGVVANSMDSGINTAGVAPAGDLKPITPETQAAAEPATEVSPPQEEGAKKSGQYTAPKKSFFSVVLGLFKKKTYPWYSKKALLTDNETEFFLRLRAAAGDDFVVLAQVSMGALMSPSNRVPRNQRAGVRSRFAQKIVDYVICSPRTMEVVALIELDDRTHSKHKDQQRDAMTRGAGYPTIRYESRHKPSIAAIKKDLSKYRPGLFG